MRKHFRLIYLFSLIVLGIVMWNIIHSRHHNSTVNKTTAAPTTKTTQKKITNKDVALQKIINDWTSQYSFNASVVAQELTGTKRTASYESTTSIVPASTFKIYVAYAILHGIEQGSYTLNTVTDDGNSIGTDLDNMILNSDNDAAVTLGFLYGWDNIDSLLQSKGITNTNLNNYGATASELIGDKHTTAQDLAMVLLKLYKGKLLNQSHTELLIGLMKTQHYRERIPNGVPSGIAVADKPGWLSPADGENGYIENDAAIVYGTKSTYLLIITTNGSTTQPLANLSTTIYNYLEN